MSISAADGIDLSKSIIDAFDRYFRAGNAGNYDHVMAVKRIITAVCSHFPNQKNQVEKSLLDYAVGLFQKEWLKQAKEEGDEYDREEELEEGKRVFLKIYKTEKDVDVW